MSTPHGSPLIRVILLADAAITGVTGLLMLFGAGPLADLLDLPTALLRGAGLVLIPYVAWLLWLAMRDSAPNGVVWSAIVANIAWAAGCAGLLFGEAIDPNGLGIVFILVQAVAVLVFAGMQLLALRGHQPDRAANRLTLEV